MIPIRYCLLLIAYCDEYYLPNMLLLGLSIAHCQLPIPKDYY